MREAHEALRLLEKDIGPRELHGDSGPFFNDYFLADEDLEKAEALLMRMRAQIDATMFDYSKYWTKLYTGVHQ